MEENKNISFKHSLESYNKKYKNRRHRILKYTKKQVEEFDAKYKGKLAKNYLLKGKKWTLIGDTYYEIPKAPTFTWFRNLKASTQVITSALLGGGVVTAITVPLVVNNSGYCTVTFDLNGGQGNIATQKVKKGEYATKPKTDPTKNGNLLKHWLLKGMPFEFEVTPVTTNITLVAEWDPLVRDVTFDFNYASAPDPEHVDVANGDLILNIPQVPDRVSEKCLFLGWKINDGDPNFFDFSTPINDNITLKAQWQENVTFHTVSLYANTTTEDPFETYSVPDKDVFDRPNDSEIVKQLVSVDDFSDCKLKGWVTDKAGQIPYEFDSQVTSDLSLYATWEINAQNFKIVGEHNIDNEATTYNKLTLITGIEEGEKESEIPASKYSNYTKTYSPEDIVTLSKSNEIMPETNVGSSTITIERSYSLGGPDDKVSKSFEVEVGSFNKLDLTELKKGIAKAKNKDIKGEVYIPKRYWDGKKWQSITKIAQDGFKDCKNITKVYISVPTIIIGKDAFKGCTSINEFEFEDEVNTWGFGDQEINPATSPDLIKQKLIEGNETDKTPMSTGLMFESDGEGGYLVKKDTDSSKVPPINLLIPSKVTVDGEGRATSTRKGSNVTGFVNGAFNNSNIETLTIHTENNLKSIGISAFEGCTSLKGVYFSQLESTSNYAPVTLIDNYAFKGCTALTSIEIPDAVSKLGKGSFQSSGLVSITLPDTLQEMGQLCFQSCTSLTTVNIPGREFDTIPAGAFSNCTSLLQISIPYSVMTLDKDNINGIDYSAFNGSGLRSVDFEDYMSIWDITPTPATPTLEAGGNNAESKTRNADLLKHSTNLYKYSKKTTDPTDFTIEQIGTTNEYKVSAYNGSAKEVVVPNYVTRNGAARPVTQIAEGAFEQPGAQTSTESIIIPNSIESIGKRAFKGLSKLREIQFPTNEKFTVMPDEMCANCPKLTSVSIPVSVNEIGFNCFSLGINKMTTEEGLAKADFGTYSNYWDRISKKDSSKTKMIFKGNNGDSYLAENAFYLKQGYKYIKRASETLIAGAYIALVRDTFLINEKFTPDSVCVNVSSNNGTFKNIASTADVRYSIKKSFSFFSYYEDITSQVKNGTFTYSKETSVQIKIEVYYQGTYIVGGPYTVKFKNATGATKLDEKFDFAAIKNAEETKQIGWSVSAKDSSTFTAEDDILLPSYYNGYPVTCVGMQKGQQPEPTGFQSVKAKSITCPDSINTIGIGAFEKADINSIYLSSNISVLFDRSFSLGASNNCFLIIPTSVKLIYPEGFNVAKTYFQDPTKQWIVTNGDHTHYWAPSPNKFDENASYIANWSDGYHFELK